MSYFHTCYLSLRYPRYSLVLWLCLSPKHTTVLGLMLIIIRLKREAMSQNILLYGNPALRFLGDKVCSYVIVVFFILYLKHDSEHEYMG